MFKSVTLGWLSALLVTLGASAEAGTIFDYVATVQGSPTAPILPAGTLQFSGSTGTAIDASLPGGAAINFGQIAFISAADDGIVTPYSVDFGFRIALTEASSNETGFIDLTGTVSGAASSDPDGSAINSIISNFALASAATLTLGGQQFLVTLGSATGPGSAVTPGVLQVFVSAASTNPVATPEPNAVIMMGIASASGLLYGLRRRRRLG